MATAVKRRTDPAPRPLRADAARNRAALLRAARGAFAEQGFDVPVEGLARGAGLGTGTVYRHFPNKDALVDAVIEQAFTELADDAAAAAAAEATDPGAAFFGFLRHAATVMGRDRVLVAAARARPGLRTRSAPVRRLFAATNELLDRARSAGAVRDGVDADDVSALLAGVGDAAARSGAWERYVEILSDGLRPVRASP